MVNADLSKEAVFELIPKKMKEENMVTAKRNSIFKGSKMANTWSVWTMFSQHGRRFSHVYFSKFGQIQDCIYKTVFIDFDN